MNGQRCGWPIDLYIYIYKSFVWSKIKQHFNVMSIGIPHCVELPNSHRMKCVEKQPDPNFYTRTQKPVSIKTNIGFVCPNSSPSCRTKFVVLSAYFRAKLKPIRSHYLPNANDKPHCSASAPIKFSLWQDDKITWICAPFRFTVLIMHWSDNRLLL